MNSDNSDISRMEEVIHLAVRERVKEILGEEKEKAIQATHERIAQEADKLALSMMKHYEINSMSDRIVIEVKKEINND